MPDHYDVFLCHNSQDKPEVIEIAFKLKQRELKPWLDVWDLPPGLSWQEQLEEQIEQMKSAAVFVGNSGFGPWQEREMRAFLSEFVSRNCPVIPVLLKSAPHTPKLPIFLKDKTWVDFKSPYVDPMEQLIWGITRNKPQFQTIANELFVSQQERIEKLTEELEVMKTASSREKEELKHMLQAASIQNQQLKAKLELKELQGSSKQSNFELSLSEMMLQIIQQEKSESTSAVNSLDEMKEEIMKVQQSLSNVLNTMHQGSMNSIRSIR